MANTKMTFYPPGGGEPVHAYPAYKQQYLDMGWTLEPKAKTEKPKAYGKTDRKNKWTGPESFFRYDHIILL